jgi:hypothetical protein
MIPTAARIRIVALFHIPPAFMPAHGFADGIFFGEPQEFLFELSVRMPLPQARLSGLSRLVALVQLHIMPVFKEPEQSRIERIAATEGDIRGRNLKVVIIGGQADAGGLHAAPPVTTARDAPGVPQQAITRNGHNADEGATAAGRSTAYQADIRFSWR